MADRIKQDLKSSYPNDQDIEASLDFVDAVSELFICCLFAMLVGPLMGFRCCGECR